MANIRSKGNLLKWVDDKGFGFITPEKGTQEIFVHISAFDRDLPRRPKAGDTVYYYPLKDENGKAKAVDAIIEGVAPVARKLPSSAKSHRTERSSRGTWKLLVICSVLIIGGGTTIYDRLLSDNGSSLLPTAPQSSDSLKTSPIANPSRYTCAGKTHCGHMESCEEATFYLQNCPGTMMDGDGDGIPCESQHCN